MGFCDRCLLVPLIAGGLLLVAPAFGATFIVPDQYVEIQHAIDATQDGDSVLVRPGTYVENIDLSYRAIVLVSEGGPAVTIIDGSQPDEPCRSATVLMSGTSGARLQGFTITGGSGWGGPDCDDPDDPRNGGGIYVRSDWPSSEGAIIRGNWITGNTLLNPGDGGGLYIQGSARVDSNRIFTNDVAEGLAGGGISARPGVLMAVIADNEVFDNRIVNENPHTGCFGGGIEMYGRVDVLRNIVACNWADWGSGMRIDGTALGLNLVESNTIVGNLGNDPENAVAGVVMGYEDNLLFTRNAVVFNIGTGVYCFRQGPVCSCNNVFGNAPDYETGDPCGDQESSWDGRNDRGERVASGAYVARIQAGQRELTRTLLLVR